MIQSWAAVGIAQRIFFAPDEIAYNSDIKFCDEKNILTSWNMYYLIEKTLDKN